MVDVHGPVIALLVGAHLRRTQGSFETSVELRELPDRWMLSVLGAAYPGQARAMRSAVTGALSATLEAVRQSDVDAAVASVRRSIMVRARTPAGLTETVGRAMEAEGDPEAAVKQVEALDGVDVDGVRERLRQLVASGPVTAYLPNVKPGAQVYRWRSCARSVMYSDVSRTIMSRRLRTRSSWKMPYAVC